MTSSHEETIAEALSNSSSATGYLIGRGLRSAFPGKALLETEDMAATACNDCYAHP